MSLIKLRAILRTVGFGLLSGALILAAGCGDAGSGSSQANASNTALSTPDSASSTPEDPSSAPTTESSSAPLTAVSERITLTTDNTLFFGRVSPEEKMTALEWTNTGFALRFRGTGIQVMLGTNERDFSVLPAVTVSIDGGEAERLSISGTKLHTLAEGLDAGEHTLEVRKITEVTANPLYVSYVQITADGAQDAPELLSPPEAPSRRIEFIGDSITCGYGNLGKSTSNRFLTEEQDGSQTYAALTAAAFGADAHYECYSGKGIVRNVNGDSDELLPVLFGFRSPTQRTAWDFSAWTPDLVVINAGTNDTYGSADQNSLRQGVTSFLADIRSRYPNATLLWCYGMMDGSMTQTIRQGVETFSATDGNTYFLAFEGMKAGEKGSVGHPNLKAHERCAEVLIARVQEITGWDAT